MGMLQWLLIAAAAVVFVVGEMVGEIRAVSRMVVRRTEDGGDKNG